MDWERVIEKELINRADDSAVEQKVCHTISKACRNVNVKDAPKMDDQIFVDGQPVPVNKDGTVNIGKKEEM